jgi:hypothetical protein
MPEFKEAIEPVLKWMSDPAAPPRQKVASLTSRDFEKPGTEMRKGKE